MITEIRLLHTRFVELTQQQLHTILIPQATTKTESGPSFHLLDLVQGVVVGRHAGVVHLAEPHHHRVAGVWVLHEH